MKIGILTLPFNNNYGGLLQSYALQAYLKERGHYVYSIQQSVSGNKSKIKQIIKRVLKVGNYSDSSNMLKFQQKYFNQTFAIDNEYDFHRLKRYRFDALIVGSDQVWRFSYIKDHYSRYFLNFVEEQNIIKLSYSASFGVDIWEASEKQTQVASQIINQFNAVSVRESSGINLCKTYLKYDQAINLLDPTLLLNASFYRDLYVNNEFSNKGKIGYYFLDNDKEKMNLVQACEKQSNLPSCTIGKNRIRNSSKGFYFPSVSQWIKDFDEVEFIITDSFHGMIFSLIFEKSFIVVGNKERGLTRLISLLSLVCLENRIVDLNQFPPINFDEYLSDIDYSFVRNVLMSNKEKSDSFLKGVGL